MRGMIRCAGGSDDETECQDVPAFPAGEIRRERVNGLVPAGVFPPAVRSKVFPTAGIRCQVLRRAGQEDLCRVAKIAGNGIVIMKHRTAINGDETGFHLFLHLFIQILPADGDILQDDGVFVPAETAAGEVSAAVRVDDERIVAGTDGTVRLQP